LKEEHMQGIGNRGWLAGVTLLVALLIAGCAAKRGPVPVEDRGTMIGAPAAAAPGVSGTPPITTDASGKPLPGIENYGKPGYYAVRPGDTIRRIGTETGQNWRDIARWNNLENPDLIEVGQVLRVIPPAGVTATMPPPATDATRTALPAPSAGTAAAAVAAPATAASPRHPSSRLRRQRRPPRPRAMKTWAGSGLHRVR
jgi:lipoprotein NlpD